MSRWLHCRCATAPQQEKVNRVAPKAELWDAADTSLSGSRHTAQSLRGGEQGAVSGATAGVGRFEAIATSVRPDSGVAGLGDPTGLLSPSPRGRLVAVAAFNSDVTPRSASFISLSLEMTP